MSAKKVKKNAVTIADMARMNGAQVARVFGVTRQAVSAWKGVPRNADRTYDLPAVVAWRLRELEDELAFATTREGDSPHLERYRAARAERAELELERFKDELVSRRDVENRWGRVLTHIIQAFDGLGRVLAPRLARKEEKEIATVVRAEVHRTIENARAMMLADKEI